MDVGGGHVTAALIDPASVGDVLVERGAPVDPHAERDALLEQLAAPGRVLAEHETLAGWSIAMPGPFDAAAGTGTFAGVDKFQSLAGIDLRAALADRLGVAPGAVRFVNDAVAYGIGEWASGAGVGAHRMICVTLGTGVGSAFLVGGEEVRSGPTVPEAGEVHRLTIDGRPLEETISSPAIRRADRARSGRERTVEEICAAARAGDRGAREVVSSAMRALGVALRPWAERFAADRVVVGGSIARSWDVIEAPLRAGLTLDTHGATHPPTNESTHPPTNESTHPPTNVSTHPPTNVSTHAPTNESTHAPTHPPTGVVRAALGSRAPLVGAAMAWASGTRPLSR
ncbi:ROK family protein [Curtobacterium sp. PhB136]|uniref:ROK family protein n=1 Tax=Curtobacterium sp. PhB136 TaxID=2485181 RepID=UPI00105382C4|nr:ROK family protein [Curtobacterium sp. PhB136]TCK61365.1 glucokinase [Curtobacterium sp. PhB136]